MPTKVPLFVVGELSPTFLEFCRVLANLGGMPLVQPGSVLKGESCAPEAPCVVPVLPKDLGSRTDWLALLGRGTVVSVGPATPGAREAHYVVPEIIERDIAKSAAAVLDLCETDSVVVALGERSYRVEIAYGRADELLAATIRELAPTRTVVVTDEVVGPLALPKLSRTLAACPDALRVTIPSGEKHKTLSTVERILRAAVDAPVDRRALVVAVGGGVVTDIAGLAAALTLRGVRWVGVPTTLLAMVDASVGGKTGVDLDGAKNAVGAFHQPSRVIVDPSFTNTEAARAVGSGMAEVVKTALIGDAGLYADLVAVGGAERIVARDAEAVTRAVRSSVTVKARVVSRDERESGERAHLNLGHTVGHALETQGNFERLTHGEAVSLGLVAALRVGLRLGITPKKIVGEVTRLLARLGLPVDLDAQPLDAALPWVGFDKKRSGAQVRFVVVREVGRAEVVQLEPGRLPELLQPVEGIEPISTGG